MKRIITAFAAALTLLACSASSAYDEGTHYQRLDKAQPTASGDKVEVVEVFWYGCPHCYSLEPAVHDWLKNKPEHVEFVRLPAALNPSWSFHAKAYYTAESLGIIDNFHGAFFDEIHLHKKRMNTEGSVKDFFVTLGVSEADFENAWNSFGVDSKLRKAKQKVIGYQLRSVPTIIVNGKYKVTAQSAGGSRKVFSVVNELVEKEK
ncbi:MAG: thiol:disulfide interchange protein DsbA/DsbL [Gammaproteobacteria bacterium]|nr:thiol:disulfide interchange protein DsbA/DsbL [Gammaproteobacteria bacterium]